MGMGECGYQETCKWYEKDEDCAIQYDKGKAIKWGCEHCFWSDIEVWCSHDDIGMFNFPPENIRNGK